MRVFGVWVGCWVSVPFGSVWFRLVLFGSVWFRLVPFGSACVRGGRSLLTTYSSAVRSTPACSGKMVRARRCSRPSVHLLSCSPCRRVFPTSTTQHRQYMHVCPRVPSATARVCSVLAWLLAFCAVLERQHAAVARARPAADAMCTPWTLLCVRERACRWPARSTLLVVSVVLTWVVVPRRAKGA